MDAEALIELVRGHWREASGHENGQHRRGRLPPCAGLYPRRSGHPVRGCPEHGAHGSAELQTGFVHQTIVGQDRAQLRPAGPDPDLNATFRLPWHVTGTLPLKQVGTFNCAANCRHAVARHLRRINPDTLTHLDCAVLPVLKQLDRYDRWWQARTGWHTGREQ